MSSSIRDIIRLIEDAQAGAAVEGVDLDALRAQGFDVDHVLYHGSNEVFDSFDRGKARTADDIYTTPDPDTAAAYGDIVYICYGRQDPQADWIDDYKLVAKLAETFAEEHYDDIESDEDLQALKAEIFQELLASDPDAFEFDAEDDPRFKAMKHQIAVTYVANKISSGDTYEISSRFQDALMQECWAMGYRTVRFADPSPNGGGESIAVVFQNADDIVIVGRL
jgi:hypothetical protein